MNSISIFPASTAVAGVKSLPAIYFFRLYSSCLASGLLSASVIRSIQDTSNLPFPTRHSKTSASDRATDGGTLLTQATYVYDVFGNRIEEDVWTSASNTTTGMRSRGELIEYTTK